MSTKPTQKLKTPLQRMTDLTRRLIAIPKSEIPTKRKSTKRKRH